MTSLDLSAKLVEQRDVPGSWGVEVRRDGELVRMAIFGGPDAKLRAKLYACETYASVLPPRLRERPSADCTTAKAT